MTDIEQKALALVNKAFREPYYKDWSQVPQGCLSDALLRAIEQHEAFRQEVSDAVEAVFTGYHDAPIPWVVMRRKLEPFIIAKPDLLVEAFGHDLAADIRTALAARGLEIVEKKP